MSSIPLHNDGAYGSGGLPPAGKAVVAAAVVLAHVLAGWALLQVAEVREMVAQAAPIFVQWVAPPARPVETTPPTPAVPEPVVAKPKPQPVIKKSLPPAVQPAVTQVPPSQQPVIEPEAALSAAEQPAVPHEPVAPPTPVVAQAVPKVIPASAVRYREAPKPVYPALSKRLNEEGRSMIRVLIDADGKAQETVLAESSGYTRLDEAALAAVRQARFYPYTENGMALAVWVQIPVTFGLNR